jgi:hypothetical protein
MDGLFAVQSLALDSRFEIRGSVLVLKSEPQKLSIGSPTGAAAPKSCTTASGASSSSGAVYATSTLSLDERFMLCRSVGEECIQEEELRKLLEIKPNPVCYDGFEPSGRMHIAQVRLAFVMGVHRGLAFCPLTAIRLVCTNHVCYDGFAQGILKSILVNKLTSAGETRICRPKEALLRLVINDNF